MKILLAAGTSLAALMMAAPALAQDDVADDAAPAIEELVHAQDAAPAAAASQLPTMSFGTWGFDPESLDPAIAPGDDFFAYANRKWLAANPLPPEFARFGAFNLLREKSTADVHALVDELRVTNPAPGTQARRIVDAYEGFLDTAAIEAAGLAPAQPHLDRIAQATTLDALAALWGEAGYPSPVSAGVTIDQKQPDTYAVYVGTGGLGLPDRQYYLDSSDKGRAIQQQYRDYLAFLLGEARYADPRAAAEAVYALEDRIAREIDWDRAVRRNRDLTYNALAPAELTAMAGNFPLARMLEQVGLAGAPKFVVPLVPPSAEEARALGLTQTQLAQIGRGTPGMFALLSEMPVATLQAWTIARFLSANAAVLPARFDEAQFALYGKTLQGTPEQRPRWKRAIDEVEGLVGEQLGEAYAARYFPAANKAAMQDLVANLRRALALSLDEIDWMSPATKREAAAKLDAFTPKIGYRDDFETYDGLIIAAGSPLANRLASARWSLADNVTKLGQPIDRSEWFMLPQTVNAYYNSTMNEIVFPAAILQPPFFNMTADPAVNYGAIGGVIGHEIGHGFDDQGSKSDGTGMLRNWWSDADRGAFDARGNALVEQYNAYCPLDDGKTCVNGRLTLGENIGDLGGLSLAYRAYRLSLNGAEAPVIDGLTGDQRFFLAWAQVWRSAQREGSARQRLLTDPHSPEEFRVNGVVRNMDAWYRAFNVTPDHALYLPPEKRITIW
ncbi:MAG: zinc metalloprotease [Citromicrobium sp.]|nr:MAG: zinc metalloprotease [Citromicrobium sp.]